MVYTKNANGDVVGVSEEFANNLIKKGKKKKEDFQSDPSLFGDLSPAQNSNQDKIQQLRFESKQLLEKANELSKNPRMQPDQVSGVADALGVGIARAAFPISSDIAESGASEADIENAMSVEPYLTLAQANPANLGLKRAVPQMLMYGGGTAATRKMGGQDVNLTESAIAGAIPLVGGAGSKMMQYVGDKGKGRAARQAYSSFVPDKNAKFGTNPITVEEIERQLLSKNKIPILSSEATGFMKMRDDLSNQLDVIDDGRRELARDVKDQIPVYYNNKPEVSHFEAVPSESSPVNEIPLYSDTELQNQRLKGQYTKKLNRVLRDPESVYMDRPDIPDYVQNEAPNPSGVADWDVEKVIEEPQKTLRSAYGDAKRRILVDYKNNKDVGNKIIASLDEWYDAQASRTGKVKAVKAIDLVSDLNSIASTFEKAQGATSAQELAKSYMAQSVNNYIAKASPDIAKATKEMGKVMSLYVPIKARAANAAVNSPVGAGFRTEASRYMNKAPQGAQIKYTAASALSDEYPKARAVARVGAEKGISEQQRGKSKMSQYGKQ